MPGDVGAASVTIELVPHLDAGDRTRWVADQDERPLSELGRRQAERLADELTAAPVDALYSSPALRCRQTLEPLARRLGISITVLPELRETFGFGEPMDWVSGFLAPVGPSLGGAYAAGLALRALEQMVAACPRGRVVACSHGDLIPAAVVFLAGAHGLTLPAAVTRRGGWHRVVYGGGRVTLGTHPASPDFPA
jgi:8-oxo-dGTP diphosphatase